MGGERKLMSLEAVRVWVSERIGCQAASHGDSIVVAGLIELFFAAACGAFVFVHLLGLPLHGGYVLAGIVIGPSGMNVVGEIVQVRASIYFYFRILFISVWAIGLRPCV